MAEMYRARDTPRPERLIPDKLSWKPHAVPKAEFRAAYHPKAAEEVRAALSYYAEIEPELGEDFLSALTGTDWRIVSAPHRWAPHIYGTRRILLPRRWPFVMIYLPSDNPKVVALAHHRREPGYWRLRLDSRTE